MGSGVQNLYKNILAFKREFNCSMVRFEELQANLLPNKNPSRSSKLNKKYLEMTNIINELVNNDLSVENLEKYFEQMGPYVMAN